MSTTPTGQHHNTKLEWFGCIDIYIQQQKRNTYELLENNRSSDMEVAFSDAKM
jgi:hypothetical protein